MTCLLDGGPRKGAAITNKSEKLKPWICQNKITLRCGAHHHRIQIPCKRWRDCVPCSIIKGWQLFERFKAGIEQAPEGKLAMFVTLTFPEDRSPSAPEAHKALESLISRLRYRKLLGEYGWVLQRQANGTLHYHGIVWLPWFTDELAEWRRLVDRSGFGPQQRIELATNEHANYCARYL